MTTECLGQKGKNVRLYFQQKKEPVINKLNQLTDATIVEDAISFVGDHVKTTNKEDREGDFESWHTEQLKTAKRVHSYADQCLAQGIRTELEYGKKGHEFQTDYGFRKWYKTQCEIAEMKPIIIKKLMGIKWYL